MVKRTPGSGSLRYSGIGILSRWHPTSTPRFGLPAPSQRPLGGQPIGGDYSAFATAGATKAADALGVALLAVLRGQAE